VIDTERQSKTGGKYALLGYGAITTNAFTPFNLRLGEIFTDLTYIIDKYKPECMAVERLFFTTNQKTAMDVAEARGVIILAAVQRNLQVFEYTPLQVKSAITGYGKATKSQVQEMTKNILKLPTIPKPDDTADAIAIAICQAHSYTSASPFKIRNRN
jgi:crossover junction endodeoxyribonuclease RuvC